MERQTHTKETCQKTFQTSNFFSQDFQENTVVTGDCILWNMKLDTPASIHLWMELFSFEIWLNILNPTKMWISRVKTRKQSWSLTQSYFLPSILAIKWSNIQPEIRQKLVNGYKKYVVKVQYLLEDTKLNINERVCIYLTLYGWPDKVMTWSWVVAVFFLVPLIFLVISRVPSFRLCSLVSSVWVFAHPIKLPPWVYPPCFESCIWIQLQPLPAAQWTLASRVAQKILKTQTGQFSWLHHKKETRPKWSAWSTKGKNHYWAKGT